jgi:type VI secretion system secreted protein Hcp
VGCPGPIIGVSRGNAIDLAVPVSGCRCNASDEVAKMAIDAFMEIDGGKVKGESEDDKYKEWIQIFSIGWGISQSGTMHTGTGGGTGKADVQDISLTKNFDKATPKLMGNVSNGEHFGEVKLVVRKAGKDPLDYITFTFSDVIVSAYNIGGAQGDDQMLDDFSLNFSKYKVEYQPQDSTTGKKKGGTVPVEYDIRKNKTIQ